MVPDAAFVEDDIALFIVINDIPTNASALKVFACMSGFQWLVVRILTFAQYLHQHF